jgi:hypothetical protein
MLYDRAMLAVHFRSVGYLDSFLSLLAVIALAGCAAEFGGYEVRPLKAYSLVAEQEGLVVAIDPITRANERKRYFGIERQDVLPVHVLLENRSAESSFVVAPEKIHLVGRSSAHRADEEAGAKTRAGMISKAEGYENLAQIVAGMPLAIAAGVKRVNAENAKYHVETERLRKNTLSPGERTQGFMFFGLPAGNVAPGDWSLRLELLDLATRELATIEIPFQWGPQP